MVTGREMKLLRWNRRRLSQIDGWKLTAVPPSSLQRLSAEQNVNYKTDTFAPTWMLQQLWGSTNTGILIRRVEHFKYNTYLVWGSVTSVLIPPCRGQDCHSLISDVHPLLRGITMGQSHEGKVKH